MINKKFLFVFIILLVLSQACNFTKLMDNSPAAPPQQDLPESATIEPTVKSTDDPGTTNSIQ